MPNERYADSAVTAKARCTLAKQRSLQAEIPVPNEDVEGETLGELRNAEFAGKLAPRTQGLAGTA